MIVLAGSTHLSCLLDIESPPCELLFEPTKFLLLLLLLLQLACIVPWALSLALLQDFHPFDSMPY